LIATENCLKSDRVQAERKASVKKHGTIPEIDMRDSFKLNEDEAAYVLTLELPVCVRTLVPWYPGTLVPWCPGTVAPWYLGTLPVL
jgi:hypothetical protein